jgi:adenosine deaminase
VKKNQTDQRASAATRTISGADVRDIIRGIPKTEIHLHLEAVATVDTIWRLITKHKLDITGVKTKRQLKRKFRVESLDQFIDLFINILQSCFRADDDLDLVLEDAFVYFQRNNIYYAEVFLSPSKLIMNGLSFPVMMEKLDAAMERFQAKGVGIRFIIDVSRSYGVENAENNLKLTLDHRAKSVIGIGLGGSESTGPAKDYSRVFSRAAEAGLRVVAHAGEDMGPESIWDALRYLKASRIGHGISAIQDEELMEHLADRQIPLEICPTSNLFTRKYVSVLSEHPIRSFYDRGIKTTVNTDDPSVFNVDLVDEYMKLMEGGFFSLSEILTLIKNGLFATFMPVRQIGDHWNRVTEVIRGYGLDVTGL